MTDAPFYAVRRLRGSHYEPTLYKGRAAAEAFADARRGYDVVPLTFAETADKYAQQARDTCARAEKAEASLRQGIRFDADPPITGVKASLSMHNADALCSIGDGERRLLQTLRAIENRVAEFGAVVSTEYWDALWAAVDAYVGHCQSCGLQLQVGPRGDVDCMACNPPLGAS